MERVLIIEDSRELAIGIRDNLRAEGYRARCAYRGDDGLALAAAEEFDLVVLDVMLPGLDGFAVCRELRDAGKETPVLFLTARSDASDRVRGLREGGDDYMVKPFDLEEFLARVAAILRRQRWYVRDAPRAFSFGGNKIELRRYRATNYRGAEIPLTHKEAQILKFFTECADQVISRDAILHRVWGAGAYPSTRTVDNFILRLRRYFETDPKTPRHFHTVHGAGYRFTKEASG